MEGKISVIGDVGLSATVAPGERGAEVVVAASGADVSAATALAPAAVLLLVDATPDDVGRVLDATLWPRQRVVGIGREDLEGAVRAVLAGGELAVRATLRDGERDVTLGRGGVVRA